MHAINGILLSAFSLFLVVSMQGCTINNGRSSNLNYRYNEPIPVEKKQVTHIRFLRYPLTNANISSNFHPNRLHPTRNESMPHNGTDFAAPKGTPVMTTADGIITNRSYQNGFGKVIYIDHADGKYTTVYAHLSQFANKNLGASVQQGEVIGYVGKTGTATGYHLHYEFRDSGIPKNPMEIELARHL